MVEEREITADKVLFRAKFIVFANTLGWSFIVTWVALMFAPAELTKQHMNLVPWALGISAGWAYFVALSYWALGKTRPLLLGETSASWSWLFWMFVILGLIFTYMTFGVAWK
jgi:hypothetical protein